MMCVSRWLQPIHPEAVLLHLVSSIKSCRAQEEAAEPDDG